MINIKTKPLPVGIFSPLPLASNQGNAVSALRITRLLQDAGVAAVALDAPPREALSAFVALNAWRSSGVVAGFASTQPGVPIVALLTGTDIFPSISAHPEALQTLEAARAIVSWHKEITLPEEFWPKWHIIPKSVPDSPSWTAPAYAGGVVRVLVMAHLRLVKDPLRAGEAAKLLPEASQIQVALAGGAREPDWEEKARLLEAQTERFTWLGPLERQEMWGRLRSSHLTVNSSELEGGANAVVESLAVGVPVLATDMPGNRGLLGADYPGYFPVGDTAGLAALLRKFETEATFRHELLEATMRLRNTFSPEREQAGWVGLLRALVS